MTKTKSLRAKYNEEVKAALKEKFGYTNDNMIPKLHKSFLTWVLVKLLTTQRLQMQFKLN